MKNLFKTSIIYFVGQILSKVMWFILLPLYTHYVSAEDYGYYDLAISLMNVIIPVIFMEIWSGSLRFSLEKDDEEKKLKQ